MAVVGTLRGKAKTPGDGVLRAGDGDVSARGDPSEGSAPLLSGRVRPTSMLLLQGCCSRMVPSRCASS